MNENVDLIREINDLKRRLKHAVNDKKEVIFNKESEAYKTIESFDREIEKNNEEIKRIKMILEEQQRMAVPVRRPDSSKIILDFFI